MEKVNNAIERKPIKPIVKDLEVNERAEWPIIKLLSVRQTITNLNLMDKTKLFKTEISTDRETVAVIRIR